MRLFVFAIGLIVGGVFGFAIEKPAVKKSVKVDRIEKVSIKPEYSVELLDDMMCLVKSNSTGVTYYVSYDELGEALLNDNL